MKEDDIIWKELNRYHKPKSIDKIIAKHRPKEISRYKENGYIVRVFEARYGCALNNF